MLLLFFWKVESMIRKTRTVQVRTPQRIHRNTAKATFAILFSCSSVKHFRVRSYPIQPVEAIGARLNLATLEQRNNGLRKKCQGMDVIWLIWAWLKIMLQCISVPMDPQKWIVFGCF